MVTNGTLAQEFPTRPLRIITSASGSGADIVARLIAPAISNTVGQTASVENQTAGIAPILTVAKAQPDGHLLLAYSSSLWTGPLMREMPYDALRDFSPVAWLTRAPNIIVVHPSLPVKSMRQLLDFARARPGALSYGTAGAGGATHLAGEMLKAMAGIDIVHAPFAGNAAALKNLLAGEIHIMFSNAGSVAPYLKSGRLRPLAVTSAERSALLPDLPTVISAGVPDYETSSIIGMVAPAKTPAPVLSRLNLAVSRALDQQDIREKLLNAGLEPVGGDPQRLATTMRNEIARLGKVIKDAGIRAD